MSDIKSKLEGLSKEQLKGLLTSLLESVDDEEVEKPVKKKRGRPRKKVEQKTEPKPEPEPEQEPPTNLSPEEIEEEESKFRKPSANRGRTSSRSGSRGKGRSGPRDGEEVRRPGGTRGAAARSETVVLSNDNKFETMSERKAFKKDSEIDKKLWAGNQKTERPDKFEYLDVKCSGPCGLWYDVHPKLVLIDPETREPKFTCDNCSPRGGHDGN